MVTCVSVTENKKLIGCVCVRERERRRLCETREREREGGLKREREGSRESVYM